MAKGTILFFFLLTTVASLLLGINIGKKLSTSSQPRPTDDRPLAETTNNQPTTAPSATTTISPTLISTPTANLKRSTSTTTYTDSSCGFSFSYPGSFIRQNSVNGKSAILTDPDDASSMIAATCAQSIPRPPVSSDKIEAITVGKVAAALYHDTDDSGKPRDEVIVKHPTTGMEIILAGYGKIFNEVLKSFKFLK